MGKILVLCTLLVSCGGTIQIVDPAQLTARDVVQGSPRLVVLWPDNPRFQHTVTVTVAGSPGHFNGIYLLAVREGDQVGSVITSLVARRVYRFTFRHPWMVPPRFPIVVALFEISGFDIYGRPLIGKKVAETYRIFDTDLLTEVSKGDMVMDAGGLWPRPY